MVSPRSTGRAMSAITTTQEKPKLDSENDQPRLYDDDAADIFVIDATTGHVSVCAEIEIVLVCC